MGEGKNKLMIVEDPSSPHHGPASRPAPSGPSGDPNTGVDAGR